jgi:hypothetical protein
MFLNISYAQFIIDFIWDKSINIILTNLAIYFITKIKNIIKRVFSKNKYINKYLLKTKIGVFSTTVHLDTTNDKKCLYTSEYNKIHNYIINNKYPVKRIINNNNSIITNYNLLTDCDFKLIDDIYVNITNKYDKSTNTILSTIELYSYIHDNDFIESFIKNL